MVLIIGSKSESPKLAELVPSNYRDLTKYYRRHEMNAMFSWIQNQSHLPKLSEDQLLVFLHATHYSVETAKKLINNYYTIRTRSPDLFGSRNPIKDLVRPFQVAYYICLPESVKSHAGNQIIIVKLKDNDPKKVDFVEGVKLMLALTDLFVGKYPLAKGVEFIVDMDGLVFSHLYKIDFSAVKVIINYCEEGIPFRLKAVHLINSFSLVNYVMFLVKPLLSSDILNKVHFYTRSELNKLTSNVIPLESLPIELGGNLNCLEEHQDESVRQIQIAADWLEELATYKVRESDKK